MENDPSVSVIINNYNYAAFLKKAIDSVLDQSYKPIEVVVVDDGSTDGSQEIISAYGDRIVPVFKENGGQPSAMNAGFAISKGEFIFLLDSDDWFESTKVEKVIDTFIQHPDIGWCFHPLELVDQKSGKPLADSSLFPYANRHGSKRCDFRERLKKGRLGFYAPPTSGLCFTRSVLERIFPLPEVLGNAVDRYIAYAAMSIGKGYFLDNKLSCQLIHDENHITLQCSAVADRRRTRHTIVNACFLRTSFPELRWFSHRTFSRGLAMSWRYGLESTDGQPFVEQYLSSVPLHEKLAIHLMALYQTRPWKAENVGRSTSD